MKKKTFPIIVAAFTFTLALIIQMTLDGVESNAQRMSPQKESFALYENLYAGLSLQTTDKKTYVLKEQDRLVLLNFWASWCLPCMKEFKSLKVLKEKFKDKILIIGINNDEGDQLKEIQKVEKKLELNFPSYADKDSELTNKFLIEAVPATLLFHKGKVIFHTNEEMDFLNEDFIDLIEDALED